MGKGSTESKRLSKETINDRIEKSFNAGYSAAIEDLIDDLIVFLKKNPKVK